MTSSPRRWLSRLRRAWLACLALAAVTTAVAFALASTQAFQAVEHLLYDVRLRIFSPLAERSRDVVILALDDRTVQDIARNPQYARNFGNYPYSRRLWARVLEHLADEGARAVVMDSVMDEPDISPDNDLALAQLISERRLAFAFGFVVSEQAPKPPHVTAGNRLPGSAAVTWPVAETPEGEEPFGPSGAATPALSPLTPEEKVQAVAFPVQVNGLVLPDLIQRIPEPIERHPLYPVEPLLRVTPALGLVLPEEDPDGRLRRTRFAYTDGRNTYVTLPVAVVADLLGADGLTLSPGALQLGTRRLAINRSGDAGLDYGGTIYQRFDTLSLVRVLNDWDAARGAGSRRLPADAFRGKVVVIGAFALGTYDVKSTPFAGETVGVAKVAAELDSLLTGRFIVDAPAAFTWALTGALALVLAALILSSRSLIVELMLPAAGLALLFAATGWALARNKLHIPFLPPATALAVAGLGGIALNHLFVNRERDQLRAIFSRFLARPVADQLAEAGELPRLDGESREITAFFSDIRSFSTFSEGFRDNPRGLVKLLNTYLTRVSSVLQEHGACLDKYIGDAVVCIFGAPLQTPTHAVDACRAALRVQAEVGRMREEFKAQGLPDVYTRVGVNTAVMFVGNFGSEQLFSYTAMGDGMNLASRLEGANKSFGTLIMIGPRTYALAKDHIEARELDRVRVAGKTEAVTVYELLALRGELPEGKRALLDRYESALTLYRDARFAEAIEVLKPNLSPHIPEDSEDSPSRVLLERCEAFLASPPEMPFDGVAKLEK